MNLLIVLSIKCRKIVKNDRHHTLESKATSSDSLFCSTNSPEWKCIHSTLIKNRKKQYLVDF